MDGGRALVGEEIEEGNRRDQMWVELRERLELLRVHLWNKVESQDKGNPQEPMRVTPS